MRGPKKTKAGATPKIGVKKPIAPTSQSSTGHNDNTDYLASYRTRQTTQSSLKSQGKSKQLQTVSRSSKKDNGVVTQKTYKKTTRKSGVSDDRYNDQKTNLPSSKRNKSGCEGQTNASCVIKTSKKPKKN